MRWRIANLRWKLEPTGSGRPPEFTTTTTTLGSIITSLWWGIWIKRMRELRLNCLDRELLLKGLLRTRSMENPSQLTMCKLIKTLCWEIFYGFVYKSFVRSSDYLPSAYGRSADDGQLPRRSIGSRDNLSGNSPFGDGQAGYQIGCACIINE